MAPPDNLMRQLNLILREVHEQHGHHVANRRPCAPRIVGAHNAQAFHHETAHADDQQQNQHDDIARLRVELFVHDASNDACNHGNAERKARQINDKRHEIQVEIAVQQLNSQVKLSSGNSRCNKHDDHAHVHAEVHDARARLFQHAKLKQSVDDHAFCTSFPVAGAINGSADRHEAPTLHQKVHAESERNQEQQIHYPCEGVANIPHYLARCCFFHVCLPWLRTK
ncbi:MAG: hypothetical protein V8T51_02700 [Senegalimassilia faecalis]